MLFEWPAVGITKINDDFLKCASHWDLHHLDIKVKNQKDRETQREDRVNKKDQEIKIKFYIFFHWNLDDRQTIKNSKTNTQVYVKNLKFFFVYAIQK